MHTSGKKISVVGIYHSFLYILLFLISSSVIGQVNAEFSADDTIGCDQLLVQFTNHGSTGPDFSFKWYFGTLGTSTDENPSFNFYTIGIHSVKLVVTNINNSEKDSVTKNISVFLTPSANLTIDSTNACVHGKVEFQAGFSAKDSARWDFGDGTSVQSLSSYMYHVYNAHGTYPIKYTTYYHECSDTSDYQIKVDGPIADISIVPEKTCKGTPVTFTMDPVSDVLSHSWNLNEGDVQTDNPVTHTYQSMGYITILLTVTGLSGTCTIEDTVHIYEVVASFIYTDTLCPQQRVFFTNTSVGNNENYWDFGNGNTSLSEDASAVYDAGNYNISLKIVNTTGCADSAIKEITINSLPDLQLIDDPVICPSESAQLSAVGGHIIDWYPPEDFDDPYSFTPTVTPDSTTTFEATITDTITHCSSSGEVTVILQSGFIPGKITVFPTDTTLIIGDSVTITIYDTLGRDLSYTWTPEISCTDCNNPTLKPLETTTYNLVISDTSQCINSESFTINIVVRNEEEIYRIGVPEAFTPNADQVNDIIKVDGWGIRKLIEFRIYNRWGTEVFFTDDINEGWDGYYKNNLQNIDTYSFIIKAEMWNDKVITKQGTFSLLR